MELMLNDFALEEINKLFEGKNLTLNAKVEFLVEVGIGFLNSMEMSSPEMSNYLDSLQSILGLRS